MPTISDIRRAVNASRTAKDRQVLNRAIRLCCPGGATLLRALEDADYQRAGRPYDSDLIVRAEELRRRRDALDADLLSGRQPLVIRPGAEL